MHCIRSYSLGRWSKEKIRPLPATLLLQWRKLRFFMIPLVVNFDIRYIMPALCSRYCEATVCSIPTIVKNGVVNNKDCDQPDDMEGKLQSFQASKQQHKTTTTTPASTSVSSKPCPHTTGEIGKAGWTLLHTMVGSFLISFGVFLWLAVHTMFHSFYHVTYTTIFSFVLS